MEFPTLTAERTTAALAWARRGVTLSQILWASFSSLGVKLAKESKMKIWPHLQ